MTGSSLGRLGSGRFSDEAFASRSREFQTAQALASLGVQVLQGLVGSQRPRGIEVCERTGDSGVAEIVKVVEVTGVVRTTRITKSAESA